MKYEKLKICIQGWFIARSLGFDLLGVRMKEGSSDAPCRTSLKDASPSPLITMLRVLPQHPCHPPTLTHIGDSFRDYKTYNQPGSGCLFFSSRQNCSILWRKDALHTSTIARTDVWSASTIQITWIIGNQQVLKSRTNSFIIARCGPVSRLFLRP